MSAVAFIRLLVRAPAPLFTEFPGIGIKRGDRRLVMYKTRTVLLVILACGVFLWCPTSGVNAKALRENAGNPGLIAQNSVSTGDLWARQKRLEQSQQQMQNAIRAREQAQMRLQQRQTGSGLQGVFRRTAFPPTNLEPSVNKATAVGKAATAGKANKAAKSGTTHSQSVQAIKKKTATAKSAVRSSKTQASPTQMDVIPPELQ